MKKVNLEDNYEEHLETKVDQIEPPKSDNDLHMFDLTQLGEIIREIREKENLSIEELAKKCDTSPGVISDLENNVQDIDLSKLSKIVRQGLDGRLELILRF